MSLPQKNRRVKRQSALNVVIAYWVNNCFYLQTPSHCENKRYFTLRKPGSLIIYDRGNIPSENLKNNQFYCKTGPRTLVNIP